METWKLNWLWVKIKQGAWKVILAVIVTLTVIIFLYNLIRPSEDKSRLLEETQINIKTAIKENEIRATLEKDKIGVIKKIYDRKLEEIKQIADRKDRLDALIRLYEELDLQEHIYGKPRTSAKTTSKGSANEKTKGE